MNENDPQKHWLDMPDFTQIRQKPYAAVNIRFECEADLAEFCRITGLKLTEKTKSAWYPDAAKKDTGMKRWK
jgi:hypothetical protein